MSLKSNYAYVRECCGSFIWKHSLLELKDSVIDGKGESSSIGLQPGSSAGGAINGVLYEKSKISHVCGAPIFCWCCIQNSYEIEGYNTKLA
jgi:hypothetical protein